MNFEPSKSLSDSRFVYAKDSGYVVYRIVESTQDVESFLQVFLLYLNFL